ncbi:MAG: fibronectin type III domain-containing protein [Lachnospiraceae bacterium]|nr:fibronectin type III domain-containing protein [Lachnospiraceae bacterium]
MKRVLALFLAVIVAVGFSDMPVFAIEQTKEIRKMEERQQRGAGASGVQTITLGKDQLSGKVTGVGDTHTYQFTISKPGRTRWKVTSYATYKISIQDTEGKTVWSEEKLYEGSVSPRKDTLEADLTKGTYYLKMTIVKRDSGTIGGSTASDMAGTWQIETGFTEVNETYPEPNNNNSQASNLAFQKTITGQIAVNDDRDIYKITLRSAGRLTMDVTSYMQYYGIELTDSSGKRVWKTDYNKWNENMRKRSDTHQIDLLAGTYYMEVSGKSKIDASTILGKSINATGMYQLKVSYQDAKVNHKEPNNDFNTAVQIKSGQNINGQIALNDSCDIFRFQLTKKIDVKISVTSYMRYYSAYIYDSKGNQRWKKEGSEWNLSTGSRKDNYTVSLEKGTYYLKITGNMTGNHNPYTGTYRLNVIYDKIDIKNAKISGISDQVYTGKVIKPKVTVKYGNTKLKNNTDYTISGSSKKIGMAKITIKGKGNYTGSKEVTFKINPQKAAFQEVKNKSQRKVKLTWKRDKNVTGYEIYRSTQKTKNYKRIKTIKKNKTTSYTDQGVIKGKTYYYKIRSYKTVNHKKYCSSYSKVKQVKIKK